MSQSIAPAGASRWLALTVLCAGMLMIVLDATIVNVALPSIQRDLGFTQAGLAWVVNVYLITFGGFLLLAGRLGDLLGRKRMFVAGLCVFTLASVACGLSTSQAMLIGARLVQGVGGAMTSAVILAVIVTTFPEPREQAKAIGFFSFTAAAGGSIGLLAGGVLTQAVNWHWIFFVNLPIGAAAVLLALRLVDSDPGRGLGQGADGAGAFLVTSALMLGVYTILQTGDSGWTSARTLGLGALAVVLMAGFLARQATAARPLLPLGLFRSRSIAGTNLIQILMATGMYGMFFMGALYLQRVLGYDPLRIGLAFLPSAALIGLLSFRYAARLNMRFGARNMLVLGLVLVAAGLALLARAPVGASYVVDLLPSMALVGVGVGLSLTSAMTIGMSAATPSDSGVVSGLLNTTAQVGGSLGLAVLVTVATSSTEQALAGGAAAAAALTDGYHLAFAICAGAVLVAVIVAATVLRPEAAALPQAAVEAVEEAA
jgi:EmrB/QacA subfamily drug resistance transporter